MLLNSLIAVVASGALVAAAGCGGKSAPANSGSTGEKTTKKASDPAAQFGPLGVGADYKTFQKVTKHPHLSPTHGKRFVEIWVNDVGYAAYTGEDDFPVGTVIVKESWERDGDAPSTTPGPLFVMEKKEAGYDSENEDWYYAIHWEKPTPKYAKRLGGPVYWQSPSKKVAYCFSCHENYDREVGLPPKDARAWQEPAESASDSADGSEE